MPSVAVDGTQIWYQRTGTGAPLVIVQGLGYSLEASWRLVSRLAGAHTVIEVDNRGVGRTPLPPAGDSLTIERMAADIAEVIDAAGLGPAHVVGFSMGGLIAGELLVTRPELLRTVTLACTSLGGADAVPFTPQVAEHLMHLAGLPARQAALESAAIVYAETTPRERIEQDIELRMTIPTTREGYTAQMNAVGAYRGYGERAAGTRTPVLVVHGDADRLVPPENAQVMARAIPGARVHLIPGAGHILTTDATEELSRVILQHTSETP